MDNGRLLTIVSSFTALSIISFSSMPFIPILTSRIAAPSSSCASAISVTRSSCPARSCSCNAFLPVGLIRSPITINGPSKSIGRVTRSLDRARRITLPCLLRWDTSSIRPLCCIFCASKRICSGVVPQQPPKISAPASINAIISSANSSASIS